VVGVVGVGGSDAREQVLIAFARKQVAVVERVLAELGQELVAGGVGLDVEARRMDRFAAGNGGRDVVALYF
jgi:hypothetical protein